MISSHLVDPSHGKIKANNSWNDAIRCTVMVAVGFVTGRRGSLAFSKGGPPAHPKIWNPILKREIKAQQKSSDVHRSDAETRKAVFKAYMKEAEVSLTRSACSPASSSQLTSNTETRSLLASTGASPEVRYSGLAIDPYLRSKSVHEVLGWSG